MTCKYIYKGKTFNSESELDDFLLEKDKYLSEFGDIVFSKTSSQLYAQSLIKDGGFKAKEKKAEWESSGKIYTEDGVRGKLKPPYMGVNEFLDGLTNEDNKLFYPQFVEPNYWKKRFLDWSEGKYTDDERELFGFTKGSEPKLDVHPDLIDFTLDESWDEKTIKSKFDSVTTKEQQDLRDKMENKWKNQALFGDVIHLIGLKLFSTIHSGPYKDKKMWIEIVDELYDLFLKQIDADQYDDEKKAIRKKFSDEQIRQAVNYFKSLKENLEKQLGESDLTFIPEPALLGTLDRETKGVNHLLGRIDLIAIDSAGNAHIVDYKTSPKPYVEYNSAKKRGYTYLLATYTRLLAQNGLRYNNIRSFVAPIQLEGFRPDTEGYTFDNIRANIVLDELTENIRTDEHVINNLNGVISVPENLTATSLNLITTVDKLMKILFPEYGKKKTEEEVKAMLEAEGAFKKRTDLEKPYGYFPNGNDTNPIVADSEIELIKKVLQHYNAFQELVKGYTVIIKNALKEGISNNTTDVRLPEAKGGNNPRWLIDTLSKYLNSNWEVLEGDGYDSAEEFGIIFLLNKHTRHIEVITTSLNYLDYIPSKDSKMQNLTYGLGQSDIIENSKAGSKMLQATNGNIRLIETMLVLNNLLFNDDNVNIAQIHVVNPKKGSGNWSPNDQLTYSFDRLMDLAQSKGLDIGENRLKDGKGLVKFATKAQLALLTLKNIQNITGTRTSEKFLGMASSISALDTSITDGNKEEVLLLLEKLKDLIERDSELSRYIKNPESIIDLSYHAREAITAYAQILWAIAECKGYNYKQLLQDHNKILFGAKGLYWQLGENPGNYASNILNTASRVMQEAYLNVRDILSKDFRKFTQAVDILKEKEGFSKFQEYTFGNLANLYKGIVYKTDDNDLMVKNPWDADCGLSEAKKDFAKMFLMEINKDRFPNKTEAELEAMARKGDYDFFKLPLIRASKSGKAAQRNMWDAFKTRIKNIANAQYYRDKVSDFLSEEEEAIYAQSEDIYKMNNMMDTGNGSNRKAFMAKKLSQDPSYFEVDLENILLAHRQAYTIQKEMDLRMPIIKAASFALKIMGEFKGSKFEADIETIEDTVKTKIKNESLIKDPKMKVVAGITKDLLQMASWMALAFAPIQATGQALNGLFTNMKLHWTSDREIFSKEHLISSFNEVRKDLTHFGTTPTLCEAINRVFGINDMDMNTYALNLSSNKHGIFHFMDRYAFKMSSRPDFYNRMTIFLSQMKADGCYEAHSLNPDGTLKYDCKKDKRYAALWTHPKGSKEYNEALSKYIPVAQQFVAERAKNADGSLFEFNASNPQPLPRAYTVQESESRKDVADSLYGYYDHTKKALFFGTYLGSLLGQMRTYWSAKKNLYFARQGSNQIKGRWIQAKDDLGNPLFWGIKENGEVDPTQLITTDTGIPAKQWQGDYAEGVFVTLMGIVQEVWNNDDKSLGGMMSTIREKFIENPNENYRRCYITNLKILAFDALAAIMLGALCLGLSAVYDDLEDDAKKSQDLTDVILADAFGLLYKSFNYAKLDFFWWESIFSPTIDWNPFAVSSAVNIIEQVAEVASGDRNVFNAVAQSFGVARQNKPIFRYLAQQTELDSE